MLTTLRAAGLDKQGRDQIPQLFQATIRKATGLRMAVEVIVIRVREQRDYRQGFRMAKGWVETTFCDRFSYARPSSCKAPWSGRALIDFVVVAAPVTCWCKRISKNRLRNQFRWRHSVRAEPFLGHNCAKLTTWQAFKGLLQGIND